MRRPVGRPQQPGTACQGDGQGRKVGHPLASQPELRNEALPPVLGASLEAHWWRAEENVAALQVNQVSFDPGAAGDKVAYDEMELAGLVDAYLFPWLDVAMGGHAPLHGRVAELGRDRALRARTRSPSSICASMPRPATVPGSPSCACTSIGTWPAAMATAPCSASFAPRRNTT